MLYKLHTKLSIYVVLFSFLMMGLAALTLYKITYDNERNESLKSIHDLSQTVYHSSTIAAYLGNAQISDEVFKGLMQNDLVEGVEINSELLKKSEGLTQNKPHQVSTTLYSPFDEKERIGQLNIYPKESFIEQSAKQTAIFITEQTFVIIVLLIIFITFIIWWIIGRPLNNLTHTLAKIDPATSDRRLSIPNILRRSEIDYLSFTINDLLDRVQEQIGEERVLRSHIETVAQNFQTIFELSSTAMVVTDMTYRISSYNNAFFELVSHATGTTEIHSNAAWLSQIIKNPDEFIHKVDGMLKSIEKSAFEIKLKSQENQRGRWVSINAREAMDANNNPMLIFFFNDITKQYDEIDLSQQAANTDHLTNLKNRRVAETHISQMITNAYIQKSAMALMVIDLDGFKEVNDSHGHDAGDLVLIAVAQRLTAGTRKYDIVSRWGGDEFVVGLDNVSPTEALKIGNELLADIQNTIDIEAVDKIQISASIGIVMCPQSAINFERAFECADIAMYEIKKSGKSGVRIYEQELKY